MIRSFLLCNRFLILRLTKLQQNQIIRICSTTSKSNNGKELISRESALRAAFYIGTNDKPRISLFMWILYGSVVYWSVIAGWYLLKNGIDLNRWFSIIEMPTYVAKKPETRFKDIIGIEEAVKELADVVTFLRDPEAFEKIGAKLPRGIILLGPPGVGKTQLARAVAGEANVPFFHVNASSLEGPTVGTDKIQKLFATARKNSPSVIFIDEFDAIGRKRSASSIHPYANQCVNQLLSEMDGFNTRNSKIIVLAATNNASHLDTALMRPGRFDQRVEVVLPNFEGRRGIFNYYLSRLKYVADDIDVETLCRRSRGLSGADIQVIVNQAGILAVAEKTNVTNAHIDSAFDKVNIGLRGKRLPDETENKATAIHEAGHAIVSMFNPGSNALHKVTILRRGHALGITFSTPVHERESTSSELLARLDVYMGGRAAEQLLLGDDMVTTGCGSDMQGATEIARHLVLRAGYSDAAGSEYTPDRDKVWLSDRYENRKLSRARRNIIDAEIRRVLDESYSRVFSLLKTKRKELKRLADGLIAYEEVDAKEAWRLVNGQKLSRPKYVSSTGK